MSDTWPSVTIADLASPSPGALSTGPFGSAVSAKHFRTTGVPMIRGSNLSTDVGVRLDDRHVVFLDNEVAERFKRSVARRGDLVFTCWGTIGQVGLIDATARFDEYIVSNKQMKLTPDPAKADSLFLYYLLGQPTSVAAMANSAIGSSVPGFNLGQLKDWKVRLPPLADQRRIAGVLGALDDLIATNQRLIASLTDLALAYASASGSSSMARVSLRDFYEVGLSGVWGEDSPTGQQVERVAVLRGKDLEEVVSGDVANPPYRFLSAKQVASRMPKVGEIWTAGSGSLGPTIPVTHDLSAIVGWPTVLYSNFVKRLVPTEDSDWYGVAWAAIVRAWRSGAFSDFVTGTAMPNLDPDAMLRGISVPALEPDARAEVNRLVELAFRSELREEVVELRRTRDELLPLLLSGRVSVREVAA